MLPQAEEQRRLSISPGSGPGPYLVEHWEVDWKGTPWENGVKAGRVAVVERGGKPRFRVTLLKGEYGPNQGGVGWRYPFAPAEEVELSYTVRFSPGFDWVRGGKLPGLCGGPDTVTGGTPSDGSNGFSCRIMWRKDGRAEAYVYHMHQEKKYGDQFAFPEEVRFPDDRDISISMRLTLNQPGKRDGKLQVWVHWDGLNASPLQVIQRTDLEWRKTEAIGIDGLLFQAFFGGSDRSWAPPKPCFAEFGDLQLRMR